MWKLKLALLILQIMFLFLEVYFYKIDNMELGLVMNIIVIIIMGIIIMI